MSASESFDEFLVERLKNPYVAEAYLKTAYEDYQEDKDIKMLEQSIDNVLKAGNWRIVTKIVESLMAEIVSMEQQIKEKSSSINLTFTMLPIPIIRPITIPITDASSAANPS